jgi:hypothetical protein
MTYVHFLYRGPKETIENLIREGYLGFKDLKAYKAGEITCAEAIAKGQVGSGQGIGHVLAS